MFRLIFGNSMVDFRASTILWERNKTSLRQDDKTQFTFNNNINFFEVLIKQCQRYVYGLYCYTTCIFRDICDAWKRSKPSLIIITMLCNINTFCFKCFYPMRQQRTIRKIYTPLIITLSYITRGTSTSLRYV